MAQYTIDKLAKYIKAKDFVALVKCAFIAPFALIAKIFIRDFWLVCEDENEARDNGFWFFRWVRLNRLDQKIAYAISKTSVDRYKVSELGKVIRYGSCAHWFWYIVADKNISSQKGGKPNAAVCYLFEVVMGLRKNNRIFLQHGITVNKGNWLFYDNTKIRMFVTAAKPEHDFVLENFAYPVENVKLLGFCRFDNLHDGEEDADLLLVMPSWRNWLGRESSDNADMDFSTTQYCIKWNEFLQSATLAALLERYDKKLIFFPHRNMQKFIGYFRAGSDRIEIAGDSEYDTQALLKRASLLITDYSSVFFDFSYMRKPVLFYQFDEEEFRKRQYAQGYFDYRNTVLGKWSSTLPQLTINLKNALDEGCPKLDKAQIESFFPLYDAQNCNRTYDAIKGIGK